MQLYLAINRERERWRRREMTPYDNRQFPFWSWEWRREGERKRKTRLGENIRDRTHDQIEIFQFDTDFNIYRFIINSERLHKKEKEVVDFAVKALNNHLRIRRAFKLVSISHKQIFGRYLKGSKLTIIYLRTLIEWRHSMRIPCSLRISCPGEISRY